MAMSHSQLIAEINDQERLVETLRDELGGAQEYLWCLQGNLTNGHYDEDEE